MMGKGRPAAVKNLLNVTSCYHPSRSSRHNNPRLLPQQAAWLTKLRKRMNRTFFIFILVNDQVIFFLLFICLFFFFGDEDRKRQMWPNNLSCTFTFHWIVISHNVKASNIVHCICFFFFFWENSFSLIFAEFKSLCWFRSLALCIATPKGKLDI